MSLALHRRGGPASPADAKALSPGTFERAAVARHGGPAGRQTAPATGPLRAALSGRVPPNPASFPSCSAGRHQRYPENPGATERSAPRCHTPFALRSSYRSQTWLILCTERRATTTYISFTRIRVHLVFRAVTKMTQK